MARELLVFVFIALAVFLPDNSYSQGLDCNELRPIRGSLINSDGYFHMDIGEKIISSRILGGDIDIAGDFSFREEFPDFFTNSSLPETERFFYMLYLALSDDRFEPEQRFSLFMKAMKERNQDLARTIDANLNSQDVEKRAEAIESSAILGGAVAKKAIREGLESADPLLINTALATVLAHSDAISGTIYGRTNNFRSSFVLLIRQVENSIVGVNVRGRLESGVFIKHRGPIEFVGSLHGGTLSIQAEDCSLSASLQTNYTLGGHLTCLRPFSVLGSEFTSRRISIPII